MKVVSPMHQPLFLFAPGRIMSMKNSNDIGDRTRDLPACSAASEPTAPPRYSCQILRNLNFLEIFSKNTQMLHLIKIRPVGAEFFHAGRRTDMTKLTVALSNSANAPKNELYYERKNWSSYIKEAHDWEGRAKNSNYL
jgi:hypothetical protein